MFLREAYAIFCEEDPQEEVSFSTFCKYRPENVLLLKETPQEQCLCEKHANFQFELAALGITYDNDWWISVLCDPTANSKCWKNECNDCKNGSKLEVSKPASEITCRSSWKKQKDKRLQRVTEEVTVGEVISEIKQGWMKFAKHVNVKRIQFAEYKADQGYQRRRIVNIDFAMNFVAEPQLEVQSALWSRSSITLFTAAVEMNNQDTSMLLVSDVKSKNKNAIFAFLETIFRLLPNVADNTIEEIIWSDGPSCEFKNQFTLKIMQYLASKFQKPFTWKFFGASHGKGKCDAIGGRAKMAVREKMLAKGERVDNVNNAADFARIAKANLPNVTVVEVKEEEICRLNKEHNLFESSKAYPGISQVHVIKVAPNGEICTAKNALEKDF